MKLAVFLSAFAKIEIGAILPKFFQIVFGIGAEEIHI
jgi:hypothetical protein